jgi:hypothetical protein
MKSPLLIGQMERRPPIHCAAGLNPNGELGIVDRSKNVVRLRECVVGF